GLSWLCRQPGMLANGRVEYFDVYVTTVIWDGQPRTVEVEAADTESLVGMSLLEHHALQIDVLTGGIVTITALPCPRSQPFSTNKGTQAAASSRACCPAVCYHTQ